MVNKKIIIAIIIVIIAIIAIAFALNSSSDDNTVHIGYMQSDHLAPLFIANATGLYNDAGLNVELHEYNNGGDLTSALASGELDVGYVGATPTISSISNGVPIKIVSAVQTEDSALLAHDSNVTSIEDLKGKTIATPGKATTQYMLLQYDLKKHGINESEIESPGMKAASMNDALKTGSIDAMLTWEPFASISEQLDNQTLVETSGEIYPDHPCCIIAVSDEFIDNHPDEVKQIVEINQKAIEQIEADPAGSVQYLPSSIVPDATVEQTVLEKMHWANGLNDTFKENVISWADTEKELGLINSTPTSDQLFYDVS